MTQERSPWRPIDDELDALNAQRNEAQFRAQALGYLLLGGLVAVAIAAAWWVLR